MGRFIGGRFGNIVPVSPNAATPSAIYSIHDQYYFKQDGAWINPQGMQATGGQVSDYSDGTVVYRSHTFFQSGTFTVTDAAISMPMSLDYLVIGGGGGGGGAEASVTGTNGGGGGGGAGRLHYVVDGLTATVTSYPVTIGAGGNGGHNQRIPGAAVVHHHLTL